MFPPTLCACARVERSSRMPVREVTGAEFYQLSRRTEGKLLVAHFTSNWSVFCLKVTPHYEALATRTPDVEFVKVGLYSPCKSHISRQCCRGCTGKHKPAAERLHSLHPDLSLCVRRCFFSRRCTNTASATSHLPWEFAHCRRSFSSKGGLRSTSGWGQISRTSRKK